MQQYLTNPLSISQAKKKSENSPRHLPGYLGVDEAGRGCLAGPVVAAAVWLPCEVSLPGLTDSKKLSAKQREQLAILIKKQALGWSLGFVWPEEIDRINILQAALLAMAKALASLRPLEQGPNAGADASGQNLHHNSLAQNSLTQNSLTQDNTVQSVLIEMQPLGILIDGPYTIAPHHLKNALSPYAAAPGLWPQNLTLLPQQAVVKGDSLVLAIAAASVLAKTARDTFMRHIDGRYPGYGFAKHKGYATAAHVAALHAHGPCKMHRLSFKY